MPSPLDNTEYKPSKSVHTALLAWFDLYGRKDLPWQVDRTPYHVWVSEIMLQQTQVRTVIPYYQRFIQRFPSVNALANASTDEVMHLWTGLGYYSRARYLHRTAQIIAHEQESDFPDNSVDLQALPGIGRSTAGAILAIAFNQRAAILDGNVKRVLTRLYAISTWPGEKETTDTLWHLAEHLTPHERIADYTQAIMDLGATVCTRSRPRCTDCPLNAQCTAHLQGLTATLPRPKTRAPLPVKSAQLLIIAYKGSILLQKRAAKGLWGNLWSLPQIDGISSKNAAHTHCQTTLNIPVKAHIKAQPAFRHTFSHFHLNIHPLALQAREKPRALDSAHEIWYNLHKPQTIGLPAPVKKLLDSLCLN